MHFITMIAKDLFRRKERSVLTMIGLAVAVCTLVTLRGISNNFLDAFRATFEDRGVDLVVLQDGIIDQLSSDLDENLDEKILEIPGVKEVHKGMNVLAEIQKENTSIPVILIGWPPGGPQFDDLSILSGRFPEPGEDHELILGRTVAEDLDRQVGDTVKVLAEDFRIVGVYESLSHFETGAAVMNLDALQKLMFREGSVTGFGVLVEESADPDAAARRVAAEINAIKENTKGEPVRLNAKTTPEYVQSFKPLQLASVMTWLVSAMDLLFGTIFLLTTMIMTVMERVREIGILRAVGWGRMRVLSLILGESLMLTMIAAVVGALMAYPVTYGLTRIPGMRGYVENEIAPIILVQGLGLAILVGIVGGLGPALRASRMMPTEALRHE